jgi:hypothetical protein
MRKLSLTLATVSLAIALAACGGGSKKSSTTTSTPLPAGCPAQALMTIATPSGNVTVAAATRKALVRKNFITVYLFSKLLNPQTTDFSKFVGSSFRVDGDGAMIADGKNATANIAPTTGVYVVNSKAPLQLVGYSVQRNNQLLTSSPAKPPTSAKLEITSLTPTIVCGTINGPEGTATFIADRIDAP